MCCEKDIKKFIKAREVMGRAFIDDPDLRLGYVSNIAMLLHDQYDITDHERRNKIAEAVLNLIFSRSVQT